MVDNDVAVRGTRVGSTGNESPRLGEVASRRKGPHLATGTYYEAPDVVEMFRLRGLNFRPHWTLMQSGEPESLGTEIDDLLRYSGIAYCRVKRHLLDKASQNGVSTWATEALLQQRLLGIREDRLDVQARRLIVRGESAVTGRRTRLDGLRDRNRASVLANLKHRRSQLDALERRILEAWRAMPGRFVDRLHDATPDVRFHCELDADDLRLVSCWRRSASITKDEETKRLESARLGEKAAISYYRVLGQQVEDASIQQLQEEGPRDWETHDLRVNNKPLDVKNSRCQRADRFTEHYWKWAKHWRNSTRAQPEEVPIVGVVAVEDAQAIVLGELKHSQLRHFAGEVEKYAEGPRIGMDVRRGDWFVPGWLFEYSGRHYSSMPDWDNVLRRWLAISEALSVEEPRWILALALSRTKLMPKRFERAEVTSAMLAFFRHVEASRRTVFWFVLHYLLSHTQDARARDDLVGHLFPDRADGRAGESGGKEIEFPLGLFDPRRYIWTMVHTLSQMIESNAQLLGAVSEYRLRGPGILQAHVEGAEGKAGTAAKRWVTILAYCGNCGKWPIYLAANTGENVGQHPVGDGACSHCPCGRGRLVCDEYECGACSGWECKGATFPTVAEAQRVARDFPGWVQTGRKVVPPKRTRKRLTAF